MDYSSNLLIENELIHCMNLSIFINQKLESLRSKVLLSNYPIPQQLVEDKINYMRQNLDKTIKRINQIKSIANNFGEIIPPRVVRTNYSDPLQTVQEQIEVNVHQNPRPSGSRYHQ